MHRSVRSFVRRLAPAGVLFLLVTLAGCGSSGTVSGKVTYKAKALTGGTVLFTSPGKVTKSSPIGEDGSYTIANIPTGPVKIAVETTSAQAGKPPPASMQPPPGVNLPPEAAKSGVYGARSTKKASAEKIPDRYENPETSGKTYTVKPGAQTHNIDLE
jgi:hypothetical protein